MLDKIQRCFKYNKVLYTRHAKTEMETEELGEICEREVFEAIQNGEVIEEYPDDEPYPSVLIYGKTTKGRPVHTTCAYSGEDDLAIVVTVYHPDVKKWIDYRRRK
jgi:hypothetical protein